MRADFVRSVELSDWFASLMIVSFFILGFWLGVQHILEKQRKE